jgi:cellulose biosynthesis protein BcsQ
VSVPIIAFFSAKSGVGTTSIVYHLAWTFADMGVKVLAVDLDPQAGLTTAFLGPGTRVAFRDLIADVDKSLGQVVDANLVLLPIDLMLATLEDEFATQWQCALNGDENAFCVLSAPWRRMSHLAPIHEAQLILVDLGPNLTSINRAGLIAADYVVVPLAPDLLSVLALEILGWTLRKWRGDWKERLAHRPSMDLPAGEIRPLGYVVPQTGTAMGASEDWANWIPIYYRKHILDSPPDGTLSILNDPNKLAILRPYPSLRAMAREARKPMFHLKPADGAIGAYLQSAEDARKDFEALARAIVSKANLPISFSS